MSVDLSVIIRTNFRKRDNEEATLKKLEETAVILNIVKIPASHIPQRIKSTQTESHDHHTHTSSEYAHDRTQL